jgi:hypothetical protein
MGRSKLKLAQGLKLHEFLNVIMINHGQSNYKTFYWYFLISMKTRRLYLDNSREIITSTQQLVLTRTCSLPGFVKPTPVQCSVDCHQASQSSQSGSRDRCENDDWRARPSHSWTPTTAPESLTGGRDCGQRGHLFIIFVCNRTDPRQEWTQFFLHKDKDKDLV